MQGLIKLNMNNLYGVQIRRDINETFFCKSETWMKTEFDENVLEYWKLPDANYIVKMKKGDGLDDDCDIETTLPEVLGAFILGNNRRIIDKFIREKKRFFKINIFYTDSDSLYIEKKYWDVLNKANLVEELCRRKIDYTTGSIFFGIFLAPIINICLTIDNFSIIQKHKIFKGLNDSNRLLDRSQKFKMIEGKKLSPLFPKNWKKSFNSGTIIPTKMKFCNGCNDKKVCDKCNNQVNEIKEFEANLRELKRHPPNEFGYMLTYYEI